jgi:hypothetical protein
MTAAFLIVTAARSSYGDHLDASELLRASCGDCRLCIFFFTSTTASRTALFMPSLSPRSKTPLAAPCRSASTRLCCCKNLAGEGSGDLLHETFCSWSRPPTEGVAGRELEVYCDGALPLYVVMIFLASDGVKFSLRNIASSTKVCGPWGGSGYGYLRRRLSAAE